jgi:hypothetical protein
MVGKMAFEETFTFEYEVKSGIIILHSIPVFFLAGLLVWIFKEIIVHHSIPHVTTLLVTLSIVVMLIPKKPSKHVIRVDSERLEIDIENMQGKITKNVFLWNELTHVRKTKLGVNPSKFIEFKGLADKIEISEKVLKKDFLVVLNSLAQNFKFEMIGFEKDELCFTEDELQVPPNAQLKEKLERNGLSTQKRNEQDPLLKAFRNRCIWWRP